MRATAAHTAKGNARTLPPLPSPRTAGTLWLMLSEEQKSNVAARMMFAVRPDPEDKADMDDYKQLLAECCYDLLRVRTEIEGGLEIVA